MTLTDENHEAELIGGPHGAEKPNLQIGIDYFWKRTNGWDWFGVERWWEVSVEFTGLNGAGGAWIKEKWRWNGSAQTVREDIRSLGHAETMKIIEEIRRNMPPRRVLLDGRIMPGGEVTRVYPRHVLAAVAEDERTLRRAFPGREPTAAQVAELCGLTKVEVEQIWAQVGKAKP